MKSIKMLILAAGAVTALALSACGDQSNIAPPVSNATSTTPGTCAIWGPMGCTSWNNGTN